MLEANQDHALPESELIRIPVSIGELREEQDHLNQAGYIVDVLVNHGMVQSAHAFRLEARHTDVWPIPFACAALEINSMEPTPG